MSDRETTPDEDDPAALRAELERVQEAARQSLSHLRGELDYLRGSQDVDRDVDAVTKQLALEQELDTLRRSLQEKERLVEATAAQCRRLEDELEDQHLAYDGLKQDLERKKLSLTAAREQVARMSLERHDIENRYQALLTSGSSEAAVSDAAIVRRSAIPGSASRFVAGLLVGILAVVIALGTWVWVDPLALLESRLPGLQDALLPAPETRRLAAEENNRIESKNASPVADDERSRLLVLGAVRDRLSDGSSGPLMLALRGGVFTMGRQMAMSDNDEGPAHDVHLEGFLIGATEVTFDEYDRFARTTGRRFPSDFGWGRGTRPVVDVSWEDARAYTEWLSRRTRKDYRLPSESEWEYAAAAGQRSFYWWGHQPEQGRAVCFDCGTIWDNRSTAPVGTLAPNPFGLYDTAGNVMEWVEDCYHPSYEAAPPNGQPWGQEGCRFRVARGGAFNKPTKSMQTTARHRFAAETRINALGFRLARDE